MHNNFLWYKEQNYWIVIGQDREHFFLIFVIAPGKITCKMIGWKSLSNGCQGKEISVCFVTMASRFGLVDEEGIDKLKELNKNQMGPKAFAMGSGTKWRIAL